MAVNLWRTGVQAQAGETKMRSVREHQNPVERDAVIAGSLRDPGLASRGWQVLPQVRQSVDGRARKHSEAGSSWLCACALRSFLDLWKSKMQEKQY